MAISSSKEEALLLLNKWRSDSARVVAIVASSLPFTEGGVVSGVLTRFSGQIATVLEDECFCITGDSGKDDFMLASISTCEISFGDASEVGNLIADLTGKHGSALKIRYSNDIIVLLFAIEA